MVRSATQRVQLSCAAPLHREHCCRSSLSSPARQWSSLQAKARAVWSIHRRHPCPPQGCRSSYCGHRAPPGAAKLVSFPRRSKSPRAELPQRLPTPRCFCFSLPRRASPSPSPSPSPISTSNTDARPRPDPPSRCCSTLPATRPRSHPPHHHTPSTSSTSSSTTCMCPP